MKTFFKTIPIVVIILIGIGAYRSLSSEIITSRQIDEPTISYGYEISKRFYFGGLSLKIWNSRGLNFNFYDSKLAIVKIIEERWIGNNRAIYLNLDMVAAKDSYSERRSAKILFDFRRGEIYATSVEPLWRTGERAEYNTGDKLWLSEEEFQNILIELDK